MVDWNDKLQVKEYKRQYYLHKVKPVNKRKAQEAASEQIAKREDELELRRQRNSRYPAKRRAMKVRSVGHWHLPTVAFLSFFSPSILLHSLHSYLYLFYL
jgi:hypothetical protein